MPLQLLGYLGKALDFLGGGKANEPWMNDEQAFEERFGFPYEEFASRVSELDQAHNDLYEKTLEVNPEAAVTWVFWLTS